MQGPLLFTAPPGAGAASGAAKPALVGAEAGANWVMGLDSEELLLLGVLVGAGEDEELLGDWLLLGDGDEVGGL